MTTNAGTTRNRASDPFGPAAAAVMRARRIGVRRLARLAGVSPGHMSRVLSQKDGKHASADLIRRVTGVLELPDDYFREQRRDRVLARLEANPALLDDLDARFARRGPTTEG